MSVVHVEKQAKNPRSDPFQPYELGEYKEEMTKSLRLRTIRRDALSVTYGIAKRIVKESGVKTKEEYWKLCDRDVRLSKDPEETFGKSFLGWVDYLNALDPSETYYTLQECVEKVAEWCKYHNGAQPSQIMEDVCKADRRFPPCGLWIDYYKIKNIDEIIKISAPKKLRL